MSYYREIDDVKTGARMVAGELQEFLARGGGAAMSPTGFGDVARALGALIALGGETA